MAYTVPTAADLKTRYAAFAAVADNDVTYWITDAQRFVDTSWGETDYAPALMALAAHNMALAGLGTDGASLTGVPGGITRMRSGSLDLSFTNEAANARLNGGFAATRYGQEYQTLLSRNRGGPRVTDTGAWPVEDFWPYSGFYGWPQ
jgi:hypothetical protein